MRVLVTGGAGFIGSHVVDALIARGDEVLVLDDLSTGARENVHPKARLIEGDVVEMTIDAPVDGIAHFASKTKVVESLEKPELYRRVILQGTAAVADLARARGARLVNISSGGAGYGETPRPATESDPLQPEAPYGRYKVEAEALLERCNGVTLRLANVYGPRQKRDLEGGVVAIFQELWRTKQPLRVYGDGSAERDYVFVGDVVSATLAALDGRATGAYNIGTGVPTSVLDLIRVMTSVLGAPAGVHHVAPRPGELRRSVLDASNAARDLLWRPGVTLAEGLRRTIQAASLTDR